MHVNIRNSLSSQINDKTEAANKKVAEQCVRDASLLEEIVKGLGDKDRKLAADCAEVLTKVAESKPEAITKYVKDLFHALQHHETKVRWESMHSIALISSSIEREIENQLPQLYKYFQTDKSTIVRDYAITAIATYASTSDHAAAKAHNYLIKALDEWGGKHAQHALRGLKFVAEHRPEYRVEIKKIAQDNLENPRGVVRKAAQIITKSF